MTRTVKSTLHTPLLTHFFFELLTHLVHCRCGYNALCQLTLLQLTESKREYLLQLAMIGLVADRGMTVDTVNILYSDVVCSL